MEKSVALLMKEKQPKMNGKITTFSKPYTMYMKIMKLLFP